MPTSFPGALDTFTNPSSSSPRTSPSLASEITNANDSILALQRVSVGPTKFNAKGYGAMGDNSTDDTTAINAAKAAAGSAGGIVTLPPGAYVTSSTLGLSLPNVTLEGTGPAVTGGGGSMIVPTSLTTDCLSVTGANCAVRNLSIVQRGTPTAGAAITLAGSQWTALENLAVWATWNGVVVGTAASGASSTFMQNINASALVGARGFYLCNATGVTAIGCNHGAYAANHGAIGWVIDGGTSSVKAYGCGNDGITANGLVVQNTVSLAAPSIIYLYDFETEFSTGDGVVLGGACVDVKLIGPYSSSNGGWGINTTGMGTQLAIVAPTTPFNTLGGVLLHGGGGGTGAGIQIVAPNIRGAGSGSGIAVQAVSEVSIMGGIATGYAYGINEAYSSNTVVVSGVNLSGNSTAPVFISDAGSMNISNCHGYNPVGHAVTQPSVPATTVAYTNGTCVDCTVFVTGGTVTVIAIGGTATGLTSGSFRVPFGQTITLTYSSAPTWTWYGD